MKEFILAVKASLKNDDSSNYEYSLFFKCQEDLTRANLILLYILKILKASLSIFGSFVHLLSM